jgi:four helix bundle protein
MAPEDGINSYRDLLVWQKSMALAKQVYSLTRSFPDDERFGLISQMRRAAVSVPSNIAEGQARQGRKDLFSFCNTRKVRLQNWTRD